MELHTLKTLLIDGDGVLWRGNEPLPDLRRFFDVLAARGIEWALLTNNAMRTLDDYLEKFARFGIPADPQRIFTSAIATAHYLRERFPAGAPLYVIGEAGLKQALAAEGFIVCDGEQPPERAAAVVAALDRQINFAKLTIATRLIRSGVPFIVPNRDGSFPAADGLTPGSGAIVAALVAATDVEPLVIGKPEAGIFHAAMRHLNADPATTAMLGDRLETDILGAQRVGIGSILVLSGVTDRAMLEASPIKPDWVFESIAEIADALNHA